MFWLMGIHRRLKGDEETVEKVGVWLVLPAKGGRVGRGKVKREEDLERRRGENGGNQSYSKFWFCFLKNRMRISWRCII